MSVAAMKTPGVYISELDAFGNAVVPVPTAVPVFIGYTSTTQFNGQNLKNKAIKITSLADFTTIYGSTPPQVQFNVTSNVLPAGFDALTAQVPIQKAAAVKAAKAASDAAAAITPADATAVAAAAAYTTAATTMGTDVATTTAAVAKAQTAYNAEVAASPQNPVTLAAASAILSATLANQKLITETDDTKIEALVAARADLKAKQAVNPPVAADVAAAQTALTTAQNVFEKIIEGSDFIFNNVAYTLATSTINYRLFGGVKFFFENGGGHCYILSVGSYDYTKTGLSDNSDFTNALTLLEKETEPTMIVIPDAVEIKNPAASTIDLIYSNCYSLQSQMMDHCGTLMNRVAILDIPGGYEEQPVGTTSSIDAFRNAVEPTLPKFNSYGAAYYPWINTTVFQPSDVSYLNVNATTANTSAIQAMLTDEFTDDQGIPNSKMAPYISALFPAAGSTATITPSKADSVLSNLSKSYQQLINAILTNLNLMPPSAAMAGIYTTVDNNEGVWVAPANVAVQSAVSPAVTIDNDTQEDLNVPIDGKSICAIRAFTGKGVLVWGARTLDGNANDWRYINVRRTLIYIEQSVKEAASAYVFAPNDPGTWVNVSSMISNFLTGLWSQGGLVGPQPADAFSVAVGLGITMTGDDILAGIMRVAVKVAVSHPAEFIDITFQQEMQKA